MTYQASPQASSQMENKLKQNTKNSEVKPWGNPTNRMCQREDHNWIKKKIIKIIKGLVKEFLNDPAVYQQKDQY